MNKLILKIIVTFLFAWSASFAQPLNNEIIEIYDSVNQYYRFKPNHGITLNELTTTHKNIFKLGNNDFFTKIAESTSTVTNSKFYRFIQVHGTVPVEYSMLNVSSTENGIPLNANGNTYSDIMISTIPVISNSQAVNISIDQVPSEKYYWQDSTMEADIKEQLGDTSASHYPIPKMIILPISNETSTDYLLAYKVRVSSFYPHEVSDIYVNAMDGSVIKKANGAATCVLSKNNKSQKNTVPNIEKRNSKNIFSGCNEAPCNTGSAYVDYFGWKTIFTDKYSFGISQNCKYRTKDNCSGTTLYTKKFNIPGSEDVRSDNNSAWTSDEGATAFWSLEKTHEYFVNKFGWNSWNGNFMQVNMYVNWETGGSTQASFNGGAILISKKYGWNYPLEFADGVGHEFTHGITANTASLTLQGEPGALNEGFSDIFGTLIEHYNWQNADAFVDDYTMFEISKGSAERSLDDPKSCNGPDTYGQINWANTTPTTQASDWGGIHTNCGIVGYWFYLIAEGGSETNDNTDNFCVQALGIDKASEIAWRTLTQKLTPTSNYANCRALSITAAEELYGIGSFEAAQVTQAWYAVGVGAAFNGTVNINNIVNFNPNVIQVNAPVSISDLTTNPGIPNYFEVSSNVEIELLDDLNFNSGTEVSLYIAPACALGAKPGNPNNQIGGNLLPEHSVLGNETVKYTNSSIPSSLRTSLKVIPNPNNGNFKLTLDNEKELPSQIIVRDIMSRDVKTIKNPSLYEYEFNLETESAGIYMISVYFANNIVSKKVIKN